MWGDTLQVLNHNYGLEMCDTSNHKVNPETRYETRACWIDDCDNLWMMGGSTGWQVNDLLFFNRKENEWVLVSGDTTELITSSYGTINIPSPSNRPSSRCGALPYKDVNGNLWLFGGVVASTMLGPNYYSDLWMYTPDTTCTHCKPKHPNYTFLKDHKGMDYLQLIYPNPANDFLELVFADDAESNFKKISIYNNLGQLLLEKEIPPGDKKINISTSDLAEGVYSLRLAQGRKSDNVTTVSKRFVISR